MNGLILAFGGWTLFVFTVGWLARGQWEMEGRMLWTEEEFQQALENKKAREE